MLPACFNNSAYVLLECSFVRPCRSTSEEAIVTNAGLNLERTEVFPGRFFPGVVLLGTMSGKRVRGERCRSTPTAMSFVPCSSSSLLKTQFFNGSKFLLSTVWKTILDMIKNVQSALFVTRNFLLVGACILVKSHKRFCRVKLSCNVFFRS